eukprot:jgi/Mesvir1/14600/Mv05271-RA.1
MVVAIGFLLNRRFYTAGVWKDWLSVAPKGQVRFFVHADKFQGADADALTEWVRECDAVQVPRVATRWGCPSVLRAETNLLDAAAACPDVTHMGLVSENTAPCVSPSALLAVCEQYVDTSLFEFCHTATLSARTRKILIQEGFQAYLFHTQFFLIAAGHYRAIQSRLKAFLDAYGDSACEKVVGAEEFVILTLVDNVLGPTKWAPATFVFAEQDDIPMHALWFDDEWIGSALPDRCEHAARDAECGKAPVSCAIRKVRDSHVLREVLGRAGVLPPGTTPTPCYDRPRRKASAFADYRY